MRILNLYAGIGGNRKLWGDEHEITAVENNESIANAYKQFFPKDNVIVGDAHEFLLKHFQEFDFIWSSPPCPSHSRMRKTNSGIGERKKPHSYPDMRLYQEIIFLQHFFKGKWIVENVISYYEPLIKPIQIGRHFIWSNMNINTGIKLPNTLNIRNGRKRNIGFDLNNIKLTHRKDQVMSNCVEPELGLHILKECEAKAKEHKIELNSHLKKDNSEGSNTDYLETRNTTEEVKKQECKSGCVDNQDDTLRGLEDEK